MMLRGCLLRTGATLSKAIGSRGLATLPPEVVIFPDDRMVVCWHPEQHFPYEFSKPLPEPKGERNSVLNIKPSEANKIFVKKSSERHLAKQLGKLTYTTMHRWFPRSRDKKAKKTLPDRPYL